MTVTQRILGAARFGATRAADGPLRRFSFIVAALLCVVVVAAIARVAGTADDVVAAARLPVAGAAIACWGAGALVAFTGASRALLADVDDGFFALFLRSGWRARDYLAGRIAGLFSLLAALTVGASVVAGIAVAASLRASLLTVAQATLAAASSSLAFSAVMAPVAVATLGARGRGRGYLALLAVLLGPEWVVAVAGEAGAGGWSAVATIPSAVATLGHALAPGTTDLAAAARAIAAVAVVAIAASGVARIELARAASRTP